jgi:terpene synthase-like protein
MPPTFLPYQPGVEVYLPELPYLLPALCHRDAAAARTASDAWVRARMGFALPEPGQLAALIDEGAALWTCFMLPGADPARLHLLCRYTEYLSVFDNAMVDRTRIGQDVDAAKRLFGRVLQILDGRPDPADFAWGAVLQDLWVPMRRDCPPPVWNRFRAEVRRFLAGCLAEMASRARGAVFDYDTYLKVRRDSVGMGMYFVLGEYALGIDLTDHLAAEPRLREIVDIALEQIMLTNDLFSFRAEAAADDYVNAVAVLCLTEGLPLQDAIDRMFTVIDGKRVEFLAARKAILGTPLGRVPAVADYLDALWHMMAGNLHWSYLTPRYHGTGHRWDGARSGVLTLHADRTAFSDRPFRDLRQTLAPERK